MAYSVNSIQSYSSAVRASPGAVTEVWVDVWICGCGWMCGCVGVWTCGCVDVGVTLALAIKNSRAAIELQLHRKVHLHAPFTSK